jgi:hypothetical protein
MQTLTLILIVTPIWIAMGAGIAWCMSRLGALNRAYDAAVAEELREASTELQTKDVA